MCQMISILVGHDGTVYAVDGVHSHSEIATRCGVNEDKCLRYEFDLKKRQLKQDFNMDMAPFEAKQSHDAAAQRFFDQCAGDADTLIAFVKRGNWRDVDLRPLLLAQAREAFNEARAPAWNAFEEAVAAARKAYDEAVAAACNAYDEAVAPAWIDLFAVPSNRIAIWLEVRA